MLKKYFLLISFLFAAALVKAQVDVNYTQYAIGAGVSYIRGYTNLNLQDNHFAENVNFTYYLTGYIPITAEIQKGTLSGGSVVLDPYNRQYTNNYLAALVHGDFQAGQIIDQDDFFSNILKNFYLGIGVGVVSDNDKVQRTAITDPTYVFPGKDQSLNLMVPLRGGYEFKIMNDFGEPFIRISISYEHNIVFGQGLDGYADPPGHFKNNNYDQYRQISFGIKFDFGSRGQ